MGRGCCFLSMRALLPHFVLLGVLQGLKSSVPPGEEVLGRAGGPRRTVTPAQHWPSPAGLFATFITFNAPDHPTSCTLQAPKFRNLHPGLGPTLPREMLLLVPPP